MVTLGKKEKKKFVRIKLGNSETGHKGFFAPIRTINVPGMSTEEVYNVIYEALEKKMKR